MKKIALFVVLGILMVGSVLGAWYFIFGGSVNVSVLSLPNYKSVVTNFQDFSVNTSNSSATSNSTATFIYNKAGNFNVSIKPTITDDITDDCADYQNDCNLRIFFYDGQYYHEITNVVNTSVPYNTQEKQITADLTCKAYSCPQSWKVDVNLIEQK